MLAPLGEEIFSEEPRCTTAFLFRRRCFAFFVKTLVIALRNPFPTRRTAFVTRRKVPFCFRCLLGGFETLGAGTAGAAPDTASGFPPR